MKCLQVYEPHHTSFQTKKSFSKSILLVDVCFVTHVRSQRSHCQHLKSYIAYAWYECIAWETLKLLWPT